MKGEVNIMAKMKQIPLDILRQSRALSQRELSVEVGLSPACISQYESGKRQPNLESASKIATFFGLPVEQIKFNCKE